MDTDLLRVKTLSEKLDLTTSRKSVVDWKELMELRNQNGFYRCEENGSSNEGLNKSNKSTDDESTVHSAINKTICPIYEAVVLKCENFTSAENRTSSEAVEIGKDLKLNQRPTEVPLSQRAQRITEALQSARTDLIIMRKEDHSLSRKLLDLREKLNIVKAAMVCDEHAVMLDNFSYELEEEENIKENIYVSDLPSGFLRREGSLLSGSSPLRHMGISKMSIDFKRFSVI